MGVGSMVPLLALLLLVLVLVLAAGRQQAVSLLIKTIGPFPDLILMVGHSIVRTPPPAFDIFLFLLHILLPSYLLIISLSLSLHAWTIQVHSPTTPPLAAAALVLSSSAHRLPL